MVKLFGIQFQRAPAPKKGGRPTKSEAEAKAAAQLAAQRAARKEELADLEAAVRKAELHARIEELTKGLSHPKSEIEQMADTLAKLKAAGVIPRGKAVGEGDGGSDTVEMVKALAPMLPEMLAGLGLLKNTGHLVQEPSSGAPGASQPALQAPPVAQPPSTNAEHEAPPAFADFALSGAFRKRSPADAADWLWANREKWPMVQGVVLSVCNLPDEQLPAYLAYLAQHFPRTVAWLQTQPAWWGEVVSLLRQKAATAA